MEKITIIINEAPSTMRAWNGLRVAAGCVGVDLEAHVFLIDAGVYVAKKGQKPPEGLKELNSADKIRELMQLGVKVTACGTCVSSAGLAKEELADGVAVGSMVDLCKSIKASSNVLSF